jgi:hypothetical protein
MNVRGWDWLVLVGGLLQVIGVVVLVIDVARSWRKLRAFRGRGRNVYLGGVAATGKALGMAAVLSGGHTPTTEERVAVLEDQMKATRDDLDAAKDELEERARQIANQAVELSERSTDDHFEAIESALLGDTVGDVRRRVGGVIAIALGIVLATIGGVVP